MENQTPIHQDQAATASSAPVLASLDALIKQTFAFYKGNVKLILGLGVLPFIPACILGFINPDISPLLYGLIALLSGIVSYISFLAMLVLLRGSDVQRAVGSLYQSGAKYFLPILWASILAAAAVIGATVLLVIPGIFVAMMLTFSSCVIVNEEKRGLPALMQSWHYVKGMWWSVFGRSVLFWVLLIIISSLLSFVIGLLVGVLGGSALEKVSDGEGIVLAIESLVSVFLINPLTTIFMWKLYVAYKSVKPTEASAEEEKSSRKALVIFAWIGVAVFIVAIGASILLSAFNALNVSSNPATALLGIFGM